MITTGFFAVSLLAGVPIAVVLCLAAIVYILAAGNAALFDSFLTQLFGGIDNYGLLALPLFMLVGEIMNAGGITRRLLGMTMAIIGPIPGALAYVNILANGLMAAILGSSTAQIAIMTQTLVPEMEREGYDKEFAVATTVSAGLLAPIIPPSLMFVVYGVMVQLPISDLFTAGIIPGIMLVCAFCCVIWLMGRRHPYPRGQRLSPRARTRAFIAGLPALSIPAVILFSVLGGVATPTESAALSCLAAGLLGAIYREFDYRGMPEMLLRTGLNSALVLYLIATANVFSWVLIYGQVPETIANALQMVATGPVSFMLWLLVILLVVGTVIDGVPGLILVVPILYPIATQVYGIDPVHFGVVVSINLVLGLVSPPVGAALFVGAAIANINANKVFMKSLPFCVAACIILAILSVFPWFTLALIR
ncbi:TRAP transporter large permease [Ensifer sp. ENS04]|uniref:TRAP transporter large permease n=1 Tax=Ensifer sp. ENS04 TaxID=2769281 RepID=UPI0017803BE1|nr:TRAP transporter large permease [Ensifer sp. ENS04]MBD9541454.1 TRAP transporter large permease [Ensifer sp. ENS04]